MMDAKAAEELNRRIAEIYAERANHCGYVGARRDEMACEFWCGAMTALGVVGMEDAATAVARYTTLEVATRESDPGGLKKFVAVRSPRPWDNVKGIRP